MKTDELRESYLAFFKTKGCVRRPSDVLVPRNDPTVLFTPAGMNQFKKQFLGIGKLEFTRAATCQKCLRTGDITNVGLTAYHHTFFEMLGNFSFGDYFKREAIQWAWEYLTDNRWLGFDPNRLTVSVYLDDDETYNIWHDDIKLPGDRIHRDGEHENFWPAGAPSHGPDGVCGPCSEIFYHPPNGGKEVELWNLVFTQFNRVGAPPDNLRPLPKKNIDTGMGLERTAAVLQGVESNFEIDILKPLCQAAGETVGVNYTFDAPQGHALRRIADHIRAVTFCVHEGVGPGNEKQNYVVRQLLRRAFLEGYRLGQYQPFLYYLVPSVVDIMRGPYPELAHTIDSVANIIREEEVQFLGIVDRGIPKFNRIVKNARATGNSVINGKDAFDLHQTDGFLIELTEALAEKEKLTVDRIDFENCMKEHEKLSGSGAFSDEVMVEEPLDSIRNTTDAVEFLGYESTEAEGEIIGIITQKQLVQEFAESGQASPLAVVLNRTPFYGEAGGQIGDTGVLNGNGCQFNVLDTQHNDELLLHIGHLTAGKLEVGKSLMATVDADRRAGICRAHSATHILHHALRKTLGESATQRGSKVERDSLRFDFTHHRSLTQDELLRVEDEINQRIVQNASVTTNRLELETAKKAGAMALFGEKYPDRVRVVSMGEFSTELCGGTHLSNTGQVGLCKIISEEPVAKGVRRVTALTGPKVLERIRDSESLLRQLVTLLKTPQPGDLPRRVVALQQELRDAKHELTKHTAESVAGTVQKLIETTEVVNDVKILIHAAEGANRDVLRNFADQLRAKAKPIAILLGSIVDGKVALTAAISKDLVQRGLNASDCVKAAAKVVGGGGGGRPDLAEAGGKFPDKLSDALAQGAKYYRSKLQG